MNKEMEKKGKRNFSNRAKVAAFWGVAVIALFVVFFFALSHWSKPNQIVATVTDNSVTESEEEFIEVSRTSIEEQIEYPDETSIMNIEETKEDETEIALVHFSKQDEDYEVIPDKYNCGAKGTLTKVEASDTVNGIKLQESGGINSFDFYYRNKDIEGEIRFESYDFSDYIVAVYSSDKIEREITLVFDNCKFSSFRSLVDYPNVNLEFNNCTFNGFHGSCAKFVRCKFGGTYGDGIVPFHDVFVKDCYISDMSSLDEAGRGAHTDGTQIYGKTGVDAKNIKYEHCRFEMPIVPGTNAINACIMLQMEYSSGIDISFSDCICNGGGYTIYALSKGKGFEYFANVAISNIAVGQSRKYGSLYPTVSEDVNISNIYDIDSLYVASVWKEDGNTHISVTNDTLCERKLVVNADGVSYEYVIPASRGGKTDYFDLFEDYPIDLDICIDTDCRYVICFDATSGNNEQIRFETWDGSDSISIPWEE